MGHGNEHRSGSGTRAGRADHATSGGLAPGKRTLTEALPVVQRKTPGDAGTQKIGGGDGGSPDAGVAGTGPTDAGTSGSPAPDAGTPPPPPVASPPAPSKDMRAFVVSARGQQVQIYVSAGVLTLQPNVFLFFHGYYANYGIDKDIKPDDSDDASGTDTAAAAMQQAKAPDTIVMLPQGIRGDKDNDGGRMGGLQPQNKQEKKDRNAFPLFVDEALAEVAKRLKSAKLEPRHIALAGHSAGGYKGIQDALQADGKYADTISDITLMDSSYADSHFESTATWMLEGRPGKTVRIIQSKDQLDHRYEKDKDNPKKSVQVNDPYWKHSFSEAALRAKVNGLNKKRPDDPPMQFNAAMKFNEDSKSDDRGNETYVIQHSQILRNDGTVQCDILILRSNLSHHQIRDNVMDDAIDTIGQGEQGNASFGKNHLPDYGRDPALSHADD
jgi:hypothetical protein